MKLSLAVNSKHQDGFKFSFTTETEKEMEIAKEISKLLIAKITKIEVEMRDYE